MAQTANPDRNAAEQSNRSPQHNPRGNSRIGPGQGGTDNAVRARLPYRPSQLIGTYGETKDSRFRTGER